MSAMNDETNGSFFKTRAFGWTMVFVVTMIVSLMILNGNFGGLVVDRIVHEVTTGTTNSKTLDNPYSTMLGVAGNTILAQVSCVLVIFVAGASCLKFWSIITDYDHYSRQMLGTVLGILTIYLAFSLNGIWWASGKSPWLESHFVKITLDDQVKVLRYYNKHPPKEFTKEERLPDSFTDKKQACQFLLSTKMVSECSENSLKTLKAIEAEQEWAKCDKNRYCTHEIVIAASIVLYYLAFVVAACAGFLSVAAAYMNLLPVKFSRRSWRKEAVIQHREQSNNLRSVLYFGSATLVVSIIWMTLHTGWVIPEFVNPKHFKLNAFYSSFIVYMTLFYIVFLLFAYIPPTRKLQAQVMDSFERDLQGRPAEYVRENPFEKWTIKNGYDSIKIGDYGAMLAPIASLILSGNLDMAKLFGTLP